MSAANDDSTVLPSVENTNGDLSRSLDNTKNALYNNASAAADSVKNHPFTQSMANGPVATNVKDQSAKTQAEFSNLAASRSRPSTTTATGQPLTHYHSFFTNLLSWEQPRASGIAFAVSLACIFLARYLDILRYAFKFTSWTLAITVLLEVSGQALLSTGLASQFRPRKYFTLSKETLDSILGDVHELINFFVIESQRIVFVENPLVSGAAFIASFLSYHLIKIVPFWGLSLIATTILFLAPLVYKTNKEIIDHYIFEASNLVNKQTKQVKAIASENMAKATSTTKQYVGDYSAKAQEMISNARRSSSPVESKLPAAKSETPVKHEIPAYKDEDFPAAPREGFYAPPVGAVANALRDENEPLIAA